MTQKLSLAEETTLLLYGSVLNADGTRSDDVFSRYGESGSLVAGALLMDLAARGRLRMERPKAPEQRARSDGWVWALAMILLFLAAMFGPVAAVEWWHVLPQPVLFLSFPLCLAIILALGLRSTLRGGRMVVADTSPVGDEMLDAVLKGLARIGKRTRPKTYIRRYFRIRRLASDLAYLRARLEWRRCVLPAASGKQSTFFGLVDVRSVDRAHPAFRAIGERVRRLLLGGEVTDADVVALALLFADRQQGIVLGRRGARPLHGLYQFFASDEVSGASRRLRALAAGDATITAQIGGELYDTFLAIVGAIHELRSNSSGGD
jgi:Golgi phosphoprotein 3 (GPP34)